MNCVTADIFAAGWVAARITEALPTSSRRADLLGVHDKVAAKCSRLAAWPAHGPTAFFFCAHFSHNCPPGYGAKLNLRRVVLAISTTRPEFFKNVPHKLWGDPGKNCGETRKTLRGDPENCSDVKFHAKKKIV